MSSTSQHLLVPISWLPVCGLAIIANLAEVANVALLKMICQHKEFMLSPYPSLCWAEHFNQSVWSVLLIVPVGRLSSVTLTCRRCSLWKPAYQLLTFAPSGEVWRRTASRMSPPITTLRSSPRSKWNGSIIRSIRWGWRPELLLAS